MSFEKDEPLVRENVALSSHDKDQYLDTHTASETEITGMQNTDTKSYSTSSLIEVTYDVTFKHDVTLEQDVLLREPDGLSKIHTTVEVDKNDLDDIIGLYDNIDFYEENNSKLSLRSDGLSDGDYEAVDTVNANSKKPCCSDPELSSSNESSFNGTNQEVQNSRNSFENVVLKIKDFLSDRFKDCDSESDSDSSDEYLMAETEFDFNTHDSDGQKIQGAMKQKDERRGNNSSSENYLSDLSNLESDFSEYESSVSETRKKQFQGSADGNQINTFSEVDSQQLFNNMEAERLSIPEEILFSDISHGETDQNSVQSKVHDFGFKLTEVKDKSLCYGSTVEITEVPKTHSYDDEISHPQSGNEHKNSSYDFDSFKGLENIENLLKRSLQQLHSSLNESCSCNTFTARTEKTHSGLGYKTKCLEKSSVSPTLEISEKVRKKGRSLSVPEISFSNLKALPSQDDDMPSEMVVGLNTFMSNSYNENWNSEVFKKKNKALRVMMLEAHQNSSKEGLNSGHPSSDQNAYNDTIQGLLCLERTLKEENLDKQKLVSLPKDYKDREKMERAISESSNYRAKGTEIPCKRTSEGLNSGNLLILEPPLEFSNVSNYKQYYFIFF